jgi:hypothetical protein
MHRSKQYEMNFDLRQFRFLPINRSVCGQKNNNVERNNSECNHRPPAPTHVFMAKRYQHLLGSVQSVKKNFSGGFSLLSLSRARRFTERCFRRRSESVTAYDLDTE